MIRFGEMRRCKCTRTCSGVRLDSPPHMHASALSRGAHVCVQRHHVETMALAASLLCAAHSRRALFPLLAPASVSASGVCRSLTSILPLTLSLSLSLAYHLPNILWNSQQIAGWRSLTVVLEQYCSLGLYVWRKQKHAQRRQWRRSHGSHRCEQ